MDQPITLVTGIIMAITVLISLAAFNNRELQLKLMFYPYRMKRQNEWHRFLTAGFIHLDLSHLLFNMLTLYFFGPAVETIFLSYFGPSGLAIYAAFYVLAIIFAGIYSYFKHQNDNGYMALGASGAVSAVIFAAILFVPWLMIYGFMPGFIFGPLYLFFCQYMARKQSDNIGHDAHFYGAVFGFLFPIVMRPAIFLEFLDRVKHIPF
jgi:membrane associated rhomboid family serine protease